MVTKSDLDNWEQRLQEELDGLKFCQDQVAGDSSIPQPIKARFRDITSAASAAQMEGAERREETKVAWRTLWCDRGLKLPAASALNDSIFQVLAKLRQLKTDPSSSSSFAKRAERLQSEYRNVLHNIEKLLKTVDASKEPRYRRGTFASQTTKLQKVPRSKSATKLEEDKDDDRKPLTQITSELKELKDALRHLKHKVEKHTHEKYEAELKEARSENDRLWVKLHSMQEEQTRLVQLVTTLSERLTALQGDPVEAPSEPRLLPKRVGQAEELLK